MADTVTKKYIKRPKKGPFGGVPYGNKTLYQFILETAATGLLVDSDNPTHVLVATDTVKVGVLPKGMLLTDCLAIVSTTLAAAANTLAIGFAYVSDPDGVQEAILAADADYFYAALATDAASRTRANNTTVEPVRLPGDVYVTCLLATQPFSKAGRLDLLIEGIMEGPM